MSAEQSGGRHHAYKGGQEGLPSSMSTLSPKTMMSKEPVASKRLRMLRIGLDLSKAHSVNNDWSKRARQALKSLPRFAVHSCDTQTNEIWHVCSLRGRPEVTGANLKASRDFLELPWTDKSGIDGRNGRLGLSLS